MYEDLLTYLSNEIVYKQNKIAECNQLISDYDQEILDAQANVTLFQGLKTGAEDAVIQFGQDIDDLNEIINILSGL